MRGYEIKTIWVLFIAAAAAYCLDSITRTEFYLTMLTGLSVMVLLVLCRILITLKSMERRHDDEDG